MKYIDLGVKMQIDNWYSKEKWIAFLILSCFLCAGCETVKQKPNITTEENILLFEELDWNNLFEVGQYQKKFPASHIRKINASTKEDSYTIIFEPSPIKLPKAISGEAYLRLMAQHNEIKIASLIIGGYSDYNKKIEIWFSLLKQILIKECGEPIEEPKTSFYISDDRQKAFRWKKGNTIIDLAIIKGDEEETNWIIHLSSRKFGYGL